MASNDDSPDNTDDISFQDVLNFQTEKTGNLLDYSQQIVLACRKQANNWQAIAQSFFRCANEAQEIAESCALAARVAADRVGDIISTEFDITVIDDEGDEDDDLDLDDDEDENPDS